MQDAESKVGPVQQTTNGYGFVVRARDSMQPCWSIEYETPDDAEQGRAEMVRALSRSVSYVSYLGYS